MSFETKFSQPSNPFRVNMRRVAEVALRSIQERTAQALNSQDEPAKPLTAAYAKQKQRLGANPVRDLRLTGSTMNNLSVLDTSETGFTIGFRDGTAELRASRDEAIEPMLKLSPRDKRVVRRAIQEGIGG